MKNDLDGWLWRMTVNIHRLMLNYFDKISIMILNNIGGHDIIYIIVT